MLLWDRKLKYVFTDKQIHVQILDLKQSLVSGKNCLWKWTIKLLVICGKQRGVRLSHAVDIRVHNWVASWEACKQKRLFTQLHDTWLYLHKMCTMVHSCLIHLLIDQKHLYPEPSTWYHILWSQDLPHAHLLKPQDQN